MSDSPQKNTDDKLLEKYLDGQLSDQERIEFERLLADDPASAEILDAEAKMCAKLRNDFLPPEISVEELQQVLANECDSTSAIDAAKRNRRTVVLAVVAIAASLVLALTVFHWQTPKKIEPFFQPRSLTAATALKLPGILLAGMA